MRREPMFAGLLNKRDRRSEERAETLYEAIVAAARRPALYRDLGAPDTLPGRFELIVLHAALVLRRLRREDAAEAKAAAESKILGQEIFDAMFRALDANLREIGVGDMSVPKRIKAMARSFYDGAKAYDAAFDQDDEEMLATAIGRIVFGGSPDAEPRKLARYAMRAEAALAAQPAGRLIADGPAFPPIEEAAK